MYICYLIMNIADIILSRKYVDTSTEINPIQNILWSNFGFNAVIYLKLISITIFSSIYFYLLKKKKEYAKIALYTANIIMLYPMVVFFIIFIYTIIYRFSEQ